METAPGWTCFRIVFSAESPIHIGWHSLGLVQRTRYYIPARNIWGALVAGLAPRLASGEPSPKMYSDCATQLAFCLRLTYFFAMPGENGDHELYRPRYERHEGNGRAGLFLGKYPSEQFEHDFISSQTSAALNAQTLSAEEGALHESEFLAPRSRGSESALYFLGYLFVRHSLATQDVEGVLENCSVGADRRYGWGRLRLRTKLAEPYEGPLFSSFRVQAWQPESGPQIEPLQQGFHLPAHLVYDKSQAGVLEGDLEVVSGRNWAPSKGSGQELVRAKVCWAPGTRSTKQAGAMCFGIEPEGLWHNVTGP